MDLRLLRYFVAVVEERHVGRAAARLHMSQPPLSRAMKQLETELGTILLNRSSAGVTMTTSGSVLYAEARTLLAQADHLTIRVTAAAGTATLTVGILADSAELAGDRLASAFHHRHPNVKVVLREADFTDPTAGLRAGVVDVALSRLPFDVTGISSHVLRVDPIGVVLRTDDPLARHHFLTVADLAGRQFFQLPEGTDLLWRAYWNGAALGAGSREGPVVRTVHECMQAVLWNSAVGLTPTGHPVPEGLTTVLLKDFPPSRLVVAWRTGDNNPLSLSFTRVVASTFDQSISTSWGGRRF